MAVAVGHGGVSERPLERVARDENPPLLIVSDMVRFRIRTNWTNSVSRAHEFELDDLADAATRDRLK